MEHNPNNLKEELLRKIRAQEVSMRPHLYFTFQVAVTIFVALCTLVLTVFIFNFLLFTLRINGHEALLQFGPRGFAAFVRFFPWEILVIDALLIFVLQRLLRQFRFGYQLPVLYLVCGIVGASAVLGFALDRGTPLNDRLLRGADEQRLPGPIGDFYGKARRPPPIGEGACHCTITAIIGNTLVVQDTRGTTTLTVLLPVNDPRATTSMLVVGDTVLIVGDREGEAIRAFGVRKLDARMPPPPGARF